MSKNVIQILTLSLITLLVWVSFQLFTLLTRSGIPPATQEQLQTLNPKLDTQLIEDLKDPAKTVQ